MKEILKRNCVRRAVRTFFQTAAGYIAVNIADVDISTGSAVKGFVISALAAGFAAVMNLKES